MTRRALPLLVVLCSLFAAAAVSASAAEPRSSLVDIEDEVMCVQCGTPLNVSKSAIADDQRVFIQQRIEQGQTKEQIKQAMVAEFGPSVLAMPPSDEGFNLAIYVVPVLLGGLGLLTIVLAARRWRANPVPADGSGLAADNGPALDDNPARALRPAHGEDTGPGPGGPPRSSAYPLAAADEKRLAAELAAFDS
ncbi:MAG: cytochrome c-type biogenesis protein CcmH [Actinomycetota bacterium]|nr:cytochrome c-type biogenesis protein CcmH [Actinomycetota bacterium]